MSHNIFDIDHVRQVEVLIKELGGVDESIRLGFVHADEKGVMRMTPIGLGYLLLLLLAGAVLVKRLKTGNRYSDKRCRHVFHA
jgi:hypothetical protein